MHLTLVLQVAGPDPQLFFREGDRVELPDHKVLLFLGTDLCQLASPPVAAAVVERAQPVSLRGGGGGGEWNGTFPTNPNLSSFAKNAVGVNLL